MSWNTFGRVLRFTTWGESHGPAIGAVVDGCPPGLELAESDEVTPPEVSESVPEPSAEGVNNSSSVSVSNGRAAADVPETAQSAEPAELSD